MISTTTLISGAAYYGNWRYTSATYYDCATDRVMRIEKVSEELVFNSPIFISFRKEGNLLCAEYDAGGLLIASAEENRSELEKDIKQQFNHAWNYYATDDDNNLNDGAKKVKVWLKRNLRKI